MIDVDQYRLDYLLKLERRPVKVIPDAQYAEIGVYSFGRGIFHKQPRSGLEVGDKDLFLIREDDFILQVTFAWEGAVGLATISEDGMYGSVRFPTFRVDEKRCFPPYLVNYFRTPAGRNELIKISPGSAGRNRVLNLKRLSEVLVPLPPLEEQRRIVARIEELATKIEEARGLRREAVEEGEILSRLTVRQVFQLAKDYQETALEVVCAEIIDNLHSNPVYADDGIPCVRSPDVGWGRLYLDTALRTSKEEYIRRTVRGEPIMDDIVLVREGGGTGKAAIVEEGQQFSLGQRVMMLRPNKSMVVPKFLLYQLLSPLIYEEQILPHCKGSASPHLNIGTLRKFTFRLPSFPEQQCIVAYLDDLHAKVDALKQLQAETQAELDALMPSVLDKAFRGELV